MCVCLGVGAGVCALECVAKGVEGLVVELLRWSAYAESKRGRVWCHALPCRLQAHHPTHRPG